MEPTATTNFARIALDCVQREWPNAITHMLNGPADVVSPRAMHPAFYGCLDWHSAVHGHWLLVRLLPTSPLASEIRAALDANLTPANLAVEAAYFAAPNRASFERPYGWAWLLQLATELRAVAAAGDGDARRWARALSPLTQVIIDRYLGFLPRQTYPVRTGVHANTAFGLAFALDHARAVGHVGLEALIVDRALAYYLDDEDAPAAWEPGGEDFFSPSLVEADLMRRVLPPDNFASWLHDFLPRGLPPAVRVPAIVSDRSDPKLAHLDGLNLSRAWCLRSIARALPPDDALRAELVIAGDAHAEAGLANVATGDYMGEHWLATFAVLLDSVS